MLLVILLFSRLHLQAQKIFTELGFGIGNILGEEHTLGKGEIYLNIFKTFKFGTLGLDFTTGGNLIPGTRSTLAEDTEILSPNDTRFASIMIPYRYAITKNIFIEPRLGFASLSYFVHTDEDIKINRQNFSLGIGLGATLFDNLSFTIRYQHLGLTPEYQGSRDGTNVLSNAASVDLILFRMAYRINWDKLFNTKPKVKTNLNNS